jgi:hypothetical protein
LRFLREILTVLAGLAVLALVAALVAPWFIDWSHHRAFVEKTLSDATGMQVGIGGDIDLKLLPAPRLHLASVRLTARPDPSLEFGGLRRDAGATDTSGKMSMSAARVQIELALAPLLRGKWQFVEAHVESPQIDVRLGEGGALHLPSMQRANPDQVAFENVSVTGGRLTVESAAAGRSVSLTGLNFRASGMTLAGPFRGSGVYRLGDRTPTFFFNTGVVDASGLRFKFVSESAGALPRVEIDAAFETEPVAGAGARLKLAGLARVSAAPGEGATAPAWQAQGPLKADNNGLSFEPVEFRSGGEDRNLSGTGALRYDFVSNRATLALEAPQIDLDKLTGHLVSPLEAFALSRSWVAAFIDGDMTGARLPIATHVTIKTPALTVGGDTLAGFSLALTPQGARGAKLQFGGGFPGRARIDLEGEIETGSAAQFRGKVDLSIADFERFAGWIGRDAPPVAQALGAVPFRAFAMKGDITLSTAGLLGRSLTMVADRSTFTGLVSILRASQNERARIAIDVTSPELNLDHLPDFTAPMAAMRDADLSLRLDARAIRLARFGDGKIDAGRIRLVAQREDGDFELRQLAIENLGGATLVAKGRSDKKGGNLNVALDASRLGEFAEVLQRIFPGVWSEALQRRATALSPARLDISLTSTPSERPAAKGGFWPGDIARLEIKGNVNGTEISGAIAPADGAAMRSGGRLTSKFSARAAQAHQMLRQIGLETLPLNGMGGGEIEIEARGVAAGGFDTRLNARMAGASVAFNGPVRAVLPAVDIDGPLKIQGQDIAPLLQILGLSAQGAGARIATDVTGRLRWKGESVSLTSLSGAIAGSKLAGQLTIARPSAAGPLALGGDLRFERLELPSLLALTLGAPRSGALRKESVWSSLAFAPALVDLPAASIAMRAGLLDLSGIATGLPAALASAGPAAFQLDLSPGLLVLRDMTMKLAAGDVSGRLAVRRNRENASITGELGYRGAMALPPDLSGTGEARVEFSATGTSPAMLAAGLAGKGVLRLSPLRIAAASPGALTRVLALADREALDVNGPAVSASLAKELAAAPMTIASLDLDLAWPVARPG